MLKSFIVRTLTIILAFFVLIAIAMAYLIYDRGWIFLAQREGLDFLTFWSLVSLGAAAFGGLLGVIEIRFGIGSKRR